MPKSLRTFALVLVVLIILTVAADLLVSKLSCGKLTIVSQVRPPLLNTEARFATLLPGSSLPGETKCASLIQRSSWEERPDNTQANHRVPTTQQIAALAPWGPSIGLNARADTLRKQITGNFTGTTDEIIQWVACKWGIDVNIIRAQAVKESEWHQNYRGDWTTNYKLCPPGTWNGTGCYQSYGILQIKYIYSSSTWPMSRDDTAFNLDYAYAYTRACYEGLVDYLYNSSPVPGYPSYRSGDLWGCIGSWYSGGWYDQQAINYIDSIKTFFHNEEWAKPDFINSVC